MSLTPAEWHRRYTEQARWTHDLRQYLLRQAAACLRQGSSDPAGLRLLEVGCGTGAVLTNLPDLQTGDQPTHLRRGAAALRYPEGEELPSPPATPPRGEGSVLNPSRSRRGERGEGIFGIDIALASLRLAQQHAPHTRLACADAHHLPFAEACFDLVIAHFLLLWVADPAGVVREMRRLVRPGGAVLALAEPDYGGRVDHPSELAQIGEWQTASLRAQGADPLAGRRLAGWLAAAGLQEVQAGVLGGQWQTQVFDPESFASEWQVIASDLASLPVSAAPQPEADRLRQADARARQDGERILYVPTFYAWGVAR